MTYSKTRLYKIYDNIKMRCYYPSATNYKLCGANGIQMCDEWKESFFTFKQWALSNGYNDNLVITRINSNENFCPSNCKFVLRKDIYKKYSISGESKTILDWSKDSRCQVNYNVLYYRISSGVEPELAILSKCSITRKSQDKYLHEAFGEKKSLMDWSKDYRCKISYGSLYFKVKLGICLESVLLSTYDRTRKAQDKYLHEAFGEKKSLMDWSKDCRCKITYNVLYSKIKSGKSIEEIFSI